MKISPDETKALIELSICTEYFFPVHNHLIKLGLVKDNPCVRYGRTVSLTAKGYAYLQTVPIRKKVETESDWVDARSKIKTPGAVVKSRPSTKRTSPRREQRRAPIKRKSK